MAALTSGNGRGRAKPRRSRSRLDDPPRPLRGGRDGAGRPLAATLRVTVTRPNLPPFTKSFTIEFLETRRYGRSSVQTFPGGIAGPRGPAPGYDARTGRRGLRP